MQQGFWPDRRRACQAPIPKGNLDEPRDNLREAIAMVLEDGSPILDAEFVGIQNLAFGLTRFPMHKGRDIAPVLSGQTAKDRYSRPKRLLMALFGSGPRSGHNLFRHV
jgi:hypothetical protein